jgi:hypothetical protein
MVPERKFAIITLTNASHGTALVTEVRDWALSAYLGLAERVPEPLALTSAELAEYTGEYVASTGVVTVTVDGDQLIGALTVDAELLGPGEDAETAVPPFPFKILPDNQFLILAGQYKGLRGGLLRDASGRVSALDLGRVFTRRA